METLCQVLWSKGSHTSILFDFYLNCLTMVGQEERSSKHFNESLGKGIQDLPIDAGDGKSYQ